MPTYFSRITERDDIYQNIYLSLTQMKRKYSTESEILVDDVVTHTTNFLPRSDWFAFQLVSKQFLRCARKRGLTAIKPNYDDLVRVCQEGNCQSLSLLVGVYEMDPSFNGNEAIINAIYNQHDKVVVLLLSDPRVDPSAYDNEAIGVAAQMGHYETIALLLSDPRVDPSAVDPCAGNNRAFRDASEHGHRAVAALLLTDPCVDPMVRK